MLQYIISLFRIFLSSVLINSDYACLYSKHEDLLGPFLMTVIDGECKLLYNVREVCRLYNLLILNNKKVNIKLFHQLVIEQDRDVQPRAIVHVSLTQILHLYL